MVSLSATQPAAPHVSRPLKILWLLLAMFVILVQGPGFVRSLKPKPMEGRDFFQEWSSARSWREDRPIYMDLEDAAERYLGRPRIPGETVIFARNAHPPPAVLLALPFAWLTYPDAMLWWNLFSLAALTFAIAVLVRYERLDVRLWMAPPVVAGTLLCSPLRQQMLQGQLNLYLLALLMGAWAAQRRRKPILSGSLIGIAAAIKLFPGFIILYLLTTRRFTAAAAAIIAVVSTTILSLVVLGTQAFRDYVGDVMPMVSTFTNIWANASVIGFWTKWFSAGVTNTVISAGPPHIPPVSVLPGLAATGIAVSAMAICTVWAYKVYRLPPDQGFGITLVAMLLLSPVSWDHYFLLLILPIVQVWKGFPDNSLQRIVLIFVVVGMMLSPVVFVQAFGQSPSLLAVFGASIHFSALLALFLVMLSLDRATTDEGAAFTS